MPLDTALRTQFTDLLGPSGVIADAEAMAPYVHEERGLYRGKAALVLRPSTTEEVARIVTLCAKAGVPIVPQGGNTGLCGGATSNENEVIVNLGRMNKVRAIDPLNYTVTVDAGCVLADIQAAAAAQDCLFPLSLAAEGSCQIGGNLSTNAGGISVLRYGSARELVLGLEVVLPDGRIWNGLRALGKDNTGYALRQLFVGAEGTLGIITGAVLKLYPAPKETATALCALRDLDAATQLLSRARAMSGDSVTAFELIPRIGIDMCVQHLSYVDPLNAAHDWYVLIEFSTSRPNSGLRATFDQLLESSFEAGIITDAVLAESIDQAKTLWRFRESLSEVQKFEGGSIKHDVSVPVSLVPKFIAEASKRVTAQFPGCRPVPFGHVGDGNVHFNVTQPVGMDKAAYIDQWEAMNRVVHDLVVDMNGSISAEHGIGRLKVEEMKHYKDPVEVELMHRIKGALDPKNLMNPGKVVDRGAA